MDSAGRPPLQGELMHEDVYRALAYTISALGGVKKVAATLWPAKDIKAAQDRLNACLNRSRGETLDAEELITLLRLGRAAGVHDAMRFVAGEAGYEARPVTPRDQLSTLQRDYVAAVRLLDQISLRMNRLKDEGL